MDIADSDPDDADFVPDGRAAAPSIGAEARVRPPRRQAAMDAIARQRVYPGIGEPSENDSDGEGAPAPPRAPWHRRRAPPPRRAAVITDDDEAPAVVFGPPRALRWLNARGMGAVEPPHPPGLVEHGSAVDRELVHTTDGRYCFMCMVQLAHGDESMGTLAARLQALWQHRRPTATALGTAELVARVYHAEGGPDAPAWPRDMVWQHFTRHMRNEESVLLGQLDEIRAQCDALLELSVAYSTRTGGVVDVRHVAALTSLRRDEREVVGALQALRNRNAVA